MNLHQLELFLFVAEEGSVTRGAERAAVSQPAVSRAISELEAALGEVLFDRGPKGVTVTEAGRVLLNYATRIFTLEREAGEALADLHGLESGRLAIGASTTIGDYVLPDAVAKFLARHPGVAISVEIGNTEAIQSGVIEGRYDVGFTEGQIDSARFAVNVFREDELVVVATPDHPLARSGIRTLSEIQDHPFVMRESGSGTREIVESRFNEAGIVPRVICALGSTTAIKSAVAAGLGMGVISALAVEREVSRGELVVIRTPLMLTRQLHVIRLGWRRESAALRSFLGILRH